MSSRTMWAVKTPRGALLLYTVANSKKEATKIYCESRRLWSWSSSGSKGYSVVRVRLTEVQDGP